MAYSNDAFELWFLLHFQNLEAKWRRNEYYAALSKHLECNYEREGKAEHFCMKIYEKLENHPAADQNAALCNAETLHGKQENLPFADQNPCTTVYLLVKELNKYIR